MASLVPCKDQDQGGGPKNSYLSPLPQVLDAGPLRPSSGTGRRPAGLSPQLALRWRLGRVAAGRPDRRAVLLRVLLLLRQDGEEDNDDSA